VGLEAHIISGFCKGYGSDIGTSFLNPDHDWNAVKIYSNWYLVECTWGAGYLNGTNYQSQFKPFYFLTPPDHFIWKHLPVDPKWQLLVTPLTKEQLNDELLMKRIKAMGYQVINNSAVLEEFNVQSIKNSIVEAGLRPTIPSEWSLELTQILKTCWEYSASLRPSTKTIINKFYELYTGFNRSDTLTDLDKKTGALRRRTVMSLNFVHKPDFVAIELFDYHHLLNQILEDHAEEYCAKLTALSRRQKRVVAEQKDDIYFSQSNESEYSDDDDSSENEIIPKKIHKEHYSHTEDSIEMISKELDLVARITKNSDRNIKSEKN